MAWLDEEISRIRRGSRSKARGRLFTVMIILLAVAVVLAIAAAFFYAEDRKTVIIRIEGTMVAGDGIGGGYVGSEYIGRQLRSAADDPLVEAIVLRVNSGGGSPVAAQEIIRDLEYARQKKPIVVSMGDIAASAAYHVSAHADVIYANPDSMTGSIGSIWLFYDISRYLSDEGIAIDVIKSGAMKDMTSPYRKLSDEERDYAQDVVDASFEEFIADVVEQRGISREAVDDARLIRGEEALEIGLVDRIGNLFDAVEGAKNLAATVRSSAEAAPS
ncbi:MAG: signal peptide peptidase SppA [Methanomicrobiales archaeon]|nr:signal peptide peptidase SppA [Methanomicrobiales archaeon]